MHKDTWLLELRGRFKGYQETADTRVKTVLFERLNDHARSKTRLRIAKVACLAVLLFATVGEKVSIPALYLQSNNPIQKQSFAPDLSKIPKNNEPATTHQVNIVTIKNLNNQRTLKMPSHENIDLLQHSVSNSVTEQPVKEIKRPVLAKDTSSMDSVFAMPTIPVKNEKKIERKQVKAFTVYGSITPSMSYFLMEPVRHDDYVITGLLPVPVVSKERLGVSFEAGVQFNLKKRFHGYSGVSYFSQNTAIDYQYYQSAFAVLQGGTSNTYVLRPQQQSKHLDYTMRNIGMQAGIMYHLKGEKLKHKPGLGLQYQFGLKSAPAGISYTNKGSSYLLAQIMYRIEYQINSNFAFYFQPQYSQALLSKNQLSEPLKIKPYRAGASFGLVYSYRK